MRIDRWVPAASPRSCPACCHGKDAYHHRRPVVLQVGMFVADMHPGHYIDEGTYALLGAASFLGGAMRMTVSWSRDEVT
jgi:hypothetical protein